MSGRSPLPVLLEREGALQRAAACLERARRGQGGVLLVCGEAGIGKTSLARQLGAVAGSRWRVVWGACEDLVSPRPLGPLRDIAAQAGDALTPLRRAGDMPAVETFEAFRDWLDTTAVCTLVVVEDVHWADQATLDFLKFLGRRIGGLPVLLVLTFRSDEVDDRHPLQRVLGDLPPGVTETLTLAPLSPQGVRALARGAGREVARLHEITSGNPFFVTELLAAPAARGVDALPTSVRAAVLARSARLDAAAREAIDAMSVVPGGVEWWLLRALLPQASPALFDACVARGLLVPTPDGLAFRHELARRATLEALPPARRIEWHRRVLAALRDPPPGLHVSASRAAHHACEAGDAAQVLVLAPLAAREAAAVGAHREAAQQYALALRFAAAAPPVLAAQLHESWSYEAGLALGIDRGVIEARERAVALWRALGRPDKVGDNLRWLSRLHWYQGDRAASERYAQEAVATLERANAGAELAWAYALRAQMSMLQNQAAAALEWGARAIALAERVDAPEPLCHALNSVGTAELFAGRPEGRARLMRSLELALLHRFHEQAARVYTNLGEYLVLTRRSDEAERWLAEGIAFDRRHDLDAWTHYLVGWLAQLRLDQGRLAEAAQVAQEVLDRPGLTLVMRLPAQTVLARAGVRRGDPAAAARLREAFAAARDTGEVQRLAPVVLAMAEDAWLRDEPAAAAEALAAIGADEAAGLGEWERGELAVWRRRCGQPDTDAGALATPWRLELEGRALAAAAAWRSLSAPVEAALALLQVPALQPGEGRELAALREALQIFESVGAGPGARRARAIARALGLHRQLPSRRGPYATARRDPDGLTARERRVLEALARALPNEAIAAELGVSRRTVERHVSQVLAKLGVASRTEAAERARRRPPP